MQIEMMQVDQKTEGKLIHPRILFTGDWLIELGFETGSLVSAIYELGILELRTHDGDLDTYKRLVVDVRRKKGQVFQVMKSMPSVTRKTEWRKVDLVIDGSFLKRIGFNVDDILVVHKALNKIKLKKLNPLSLGLSGYASFQIMTVGRVCGKYDIFPCMTIGSIVLGKCGLLIGHHLKATYTSDSIHLEICDDIPDLHSGKRYKTHFTVRGKMQEKIRRAYITIQGAWIEALGYQVGDHLLVGMRQGSMIIKRLDLEKL